MERVGRRGRQQFQSNCTFKPLNDQKHQQYDPIYHQEHEESPSTSSQNPQSSVPISQFIPNSETNTKTPNSTRVRRNSRWGSRNKGKHVVKPQFVKKSEVGSSSSCGVGGEKEEGESSGGVIEPSSLSYCEGSNLGGEDEVKKDLEGERIEGSNSKEGVDEISSILEELISGGEEPELEEEILRINDQLQEDELLAMESIYGENLFILDKLNGLRSFQIHVHVETLRELMISTKLNLSEDIETHTDGSNEFSCSFKVQHLPPIILTFLLPKSYPSHLPPYFTISVQWLESSKISKLCSMLDSIWKELPGQEVIYQWTEWLHTSSLSYLGFDEEIVLGPHGMRKNGDMRAISGCISPDADIPSLKSYNDVQLHEDFCKNLHECCICFSEYAGTDFIRLPCQHFFCGKCMKTYSDIHIKEGTVNKLLCPDTKCGGMIPPGVLRLLVGDEEYARWELLMLEKTLESMSDVVYCPRCETACIVDEDEHAQCSKCFFSFCTLCRDRRHVGLSCGTPEMKLRILQERQNSTQLEDNQRHREKGLIEELLSVREIFSYSKQCPSCKMAINRTEGCNHMICRNCETEFCYRCSKAIKGYDHFRGGACELHQEERRQRNGVRQIRDVVFGDRQEEGRPMNGREVVRQIRAIFFGNSGHSCPGCGQNNKKVGNNNHILCGACQNHYCYLCKKMVRRSAQHFGPSGCKQHTVEEQVS